MDETIHLKIQKALRDNVITPEEAQEILRAYDSDIRWNNRLIENVLQEHGHQVFLSSGYRQGFLKAQEAQAETIVKKRTSLDSKTKQKLVWLSIVGPATIVSLIGLLT